MLSQGNASITTVVRVCVVHMQKVLASGTLLSLDKE